MNIKRLKEYARLIVKVGLNVQKGQDVMLTCGLEQQDFINILVEELYIAGARKVFIDYRNTDIKKLEYKYQSIEELGKVETFEEERFKYIAETFPCRLFIESEDPDAFKDVDSDKISSANRLRMKTIIKYRDRYDTKCQWCIAGAPSLKWAKKVFPNLKDDEAIEALWEAILKVSRAYEGNPISNWMEHDANLIKKAEYLNALNLDRLEYKSSNGTDFKVWLIEGCKWLGGGEYGEESRIYFQPNIPTEEIFSSPLAGKCEGVVVATKPLSLNGKLVEDFKIYFKNGEVYKVEAKKGEQDLRNLIAMDEGSKKLGECALVPFSSPINQSNLTFFSTLYDENACCHLALGEGFSNLIPGYEKLSKDELKRLGINSSMIHVDFMIGSKDLSIIGYTKEDEAIILFKDGEWAF